MTDNSPQLPDPLPTQEPLIEPPSDFRTKLRQFFAARTSRLKTSIGESAGRFRARMQQSGGEPAAILDWAGETFQKQGANFYGAAFTIAACAYFTADITSLVLGRFIPEPPAARMSYRPGTGGTRKIRTIDDYNLIFSRNLFNSQGLIPGEEVGDGKGQDLGGLPVKTSLPFNLIGTMILKDELKSIATIEDRAAQLVYPVRVEDEIPTKARIVRIEPYRVIFVNTATGRREYVELPEEAIANTRVAIGTPAKVGGAGIAQLSPTQFSVSRKKIDEALADLNNILTQARAVPNFENGMPNGYKLFQIVPGSIYSQLGLVDGDVILGINGETINDPGKAWEKLSGLKEAKNLELNIKRNGRAQSNSYDFN